MTDKVLIWSNEHSAWWRPNSQGYAINLACAGLYERAEAEEIVEATKGRNEQIVDLDYGFKQLQAQALDADTAIIEAMRSLKATDISRRS